jgi:hypothetical protein
MSIKSILGLDRRRRITIVVATRDPRALETLGRAEEDFPLERREAVTTAGLYRAMPQAHLVVADLEELIESPQMPLARLRQVLTEGGMVTVDGATLAADPEVYLARARAASGLTTALPSRCVAFSGLAGGVGKTTLSLSLARAFRHRTDLPTAVIELCLGPSGIQALIGGGQDCPHLYEAVTQDKDWSSWEGITLGLMDWETARLLDEGRFEGAWRALGERHVLTIIDGPSYHPCWPVAAELADLVFAVTDGRADALATASYLAGQGGHRVLLNRGGVAARLALEEGPAAALPDVGTAARRFPARLGSRLMSLVYPGWRA